ncbi:cysteine hydrolase family protein [Bacillus sp. CECT 9360]|uniref:cysteine hydrolase family protein n=1 Tax=Bacillus sp. CECT 9360 TaxID=2845821 RepID=UPI001E556784|nr:cysteine hydrolase family protein [Bacillus sp. CECT 9360]CAH0344965.1 Peroxyureidoacrylate/ureidoacrylate amidohydrolase RutB [Bacillus sp. CECT 9360]
MNEFDTALLLIDFQKAFHDKIWGNRNNPTAERNAQELLGKFRQNHWPIIHTQHLSNNPDSLLYKNGGATEFIDGLLPEANEKVIVKHVNSAFIGTELEDYLRENGITRLITAGLVTDHCVSTTVRMGGNLGFEMIVAEDATATFDHEDFISGQIFTADIIHRVHLSSLHGEFAIVKSTADILDSI